MAIQKQDNTSVVTVTPQTQLQIIQGWGQAFDELITAQKVKLSQKEKEFGMSIIANLSDRCITGNININNLNMTNFLEQVKHCSKLQLSINEQELYLDIRNDKNTGLKTVKISKQYQGIEKLMIKYCSKKIVRFLKDVVCKGDVFETTRDFNLGINKIIKHIISPTVDRNRLENIEKVYYIAYVEEFGQLVPYTVIIDKNRIMRAKNAASTDAIWNADAKKMSIKTAAWEMWNFMKPYIELPIGLQESFNAINDEMDWNKGTDVDTNKVYNVNSNVNYEEVSPLEDKIENPVNTIEPTKIESKEKEIPVLNLSEVIKNETDENVKFIYYAKYKQEPEKYIIENFANGCQAFFKNEQGKGMIRVREKPQEV